MIEKKDEASTPSCSGSDPAANLAQSHQLLQLSTSQVQERLRDSFARLSKALEAREKQLLRQVDVLHSQQIALLQSRSSLPADCQIDEVVKSVPQVAVDLDQEKALCKSILSYGKVDVEGGNLVAIEGNVSPFSVPYRLEDYQDANQDHVCLYKPLSNESTPVIRFSFPPRLNVPSDASISTMNSAASPSSDAKPAESESRSSMNDSLMAEGQCPSQVQQWLQQIMVETETEPSVGEQEKNFAAIAHLQELID
ncbi:hypothetical protein C0J52_00835 [Blattella germanica]|nr:hypothetical protein C0J52_00835 [Blattella germanica]